MSFTLKQLVTRNILNIPGWNSKRKIVVIESDDWGSIRMASKQAYYEFLAKGYPVDQCAYNRYDALESNTDLELLFDVLQSVKDKNQHPAIITANAVMANPDFSKIKENNFNHYHYEGFLKTLQRYPEHDRVINLYKAGLDSRLIKPQFHGREHLNVNRWMDDLRKNITYTHDAFAKDMFTLHTKPIADNMNEYMNALDFNTEAEKHNCIGSLQEGLQMFQQTFGFESASFIAPSYIWHKDYESVLAANGVNFIQGMIFQKQSVLDKNEVYKKIYHHQGEQNKYHQRYLVRNVFFEPSQNQSFDWINDALHRISIAFRWHKPAIICSHRLNFIGSIDPDNRSKNLKQFKLLLNKIISIWPAVEFMSSDELGSLMNNS